MIKSTLPPNHGDQHLPEGSDPTRFDWGIAHAAFTGPEIEGGATKLLVDARADTIVIPLDFFYVPSEDFSWTEDSPGASSVELDSETVTTWYFFPFEAFGVTEWASLPVMILDPSSNGIPRTLIGKSLSAKVAAGSGLAVVAGDFEVFARWYRVRITT